MKSPAFRFYPSDFMGSPDVQAMDLHEVGAYTLLLCTAWLSERHGYLPDNEDHIRRWARMTPSQWRKSREIILKKFPVAEKNWRCNPRMLEEADKQSKYVQSRVDNGKMGGRPKKHVVSEENHVVSEKEAQQKPSVSVSVSASVETKTKPSRAKKPREGPTKTELVQTRHDEFKGAIQEYWDATNPGVEMPWNGAEGKQLGMWLGASPKTTVEQFKTFLRNRFRSQVNHSERPSLWISRVTSYATGPLNQFKQPVNGGTNGNRHFKGKTSANIDAAKAAIQAIEDRCAVGDFGDTSAGQTGV